MYYHYGFYSLDKNISDELIEICIDKAVQENIALTDDERTLNYVYFAGNGEVVGYGFESRQYGCYPYSQGSETGIYVHFAWYELEDAEIFGSFWIPQQEEIA